MEPHQFAGVASSGAERDLGIKVLWILQRGRLNAGQVRTRRSPGFPAPRPLLIAGSPVMLSWAMSQNISRIY
jgi:hypothetical protein